MRFRCFPGDDISLHPTTARHSIVSEFFMRVLVRVGERFK